MLPRAASAVCFSGKVNRRFPRIFADENQSKERRLCARSSGFSRAGAPRKRGTPNGQNALTSKTSASICANLRLKKRTADERRFAQMKIKARSAGFALGVPASAGPPCRANAGLRTEDLHSRQKHLRPSAQI